MKTSELEGSQLDYWVARARGIKTENIRIAPLIPGSNGNPICQVLTGYEDDPGAFSFRPARPSTNWLDGGPLLRQYGAGLVKVHDYGNEWWNSRVMLESTERLGIGEGPAPLIALCRAIVASAYGDDVPDEGPVSHG